MDFRLSGPYPFRSGLRLARFEATPARACPALEKIRWNMAAVRRPVWVFCRLG